MISTSSASSASVSTSIKQSFASSSTIVQNTNFARKIRPMTQAVPDLSDGSHKCMCAMQTAEFFCSCKKCMNDRPSGRPFGSTTTGRVGTDEGSPRSTPDPRRNKTPSQPKPNNQQNADKEITNLLENIPKILSGAFESTNEMIIKSVRRAGEILESRRCADYWNSEEGQQELLKKIEERNQGPPSEHLSMFDYTDATKALLSSADVRSDDNEGWVEVELCADTGACDTVIPRKMCQGIAITPSLQSMQCMEYEVADGNTIPNLGERRCVMWTDGATDPRHINLQVADVHKALLSMSRCADMGFESRFGRVAGALIDEESGEVIPLPCKWNLYVRQCWLTAAPFGRQESR